MVNGVGFEGQQFVKAEDLMERDTQTGLWLKPFGALRKRWERIKYRDAIRKVAIGMNFMVVGIEHQNLTDYLMPLRVMLYDAAEYQKQADEIRKKIRKRRGIRAAEFLSGFAKDSRLYPCMTIVLYWGREEWDGEQDLYGILDFSSIPQSLRKLINNYRINLVEVRKFKDTSVFHTDLKQVFDFIRCSDDKTKLQELVENDPAYTEMEEDAFELVAAFTDSEELMSIKKFRGKGEKYDMCKGLKDWIEEEKAAGIEQGIERGICAMILDNLEEGISEERICEKLCRRFELDKEQAEAYIAKYGKIKS